MSNEQRKTTDYQIKKASEYNKTHYIQIALRLSPEDAETVAKIATETRQSKNAVITTAIHLYAQSLTAAGTATPGTTSPAPEQISPGTVTASTDNPGEDQLTTTPTAGATETPPEPRQDGQPDYISTTGNAPQRAAQNATERAGEDQPGQIRIYTETELKQAIEEAAQQAAQKAARQTRQEIKREMRAQAIQATGLTIGTARRAKAATVSTVKGLKPLRIRRGKK